MNVLPSLSIVQCVETVTFALVIGDGNEETSDLLLQYSDVFRAPYLTAAGVHKFWATKSCVVAPDIYKILLQLCPLTCRNVCQCTCIEHRAPDNSEVHRSLHSVELASCQLYGAYIERRRLDVWKTCGPFYYTICTI